MSNFREIGRVNGIDSDTGQPVPVQVGHIRGHVVLAAPGLVLVTPHDAGEIIALMAEAQKWADEELRTAVSEKRVLHWSGASA